MQVSVQFFSYFRDLTGCERTTETLPDRAPLRELLERLRRRFPRLRDMERSTLVAVGVEYQPHDYVLHEGDEVSLFPPVQGG
ncbi:MAG TPA: MoaD/ThiS family protein [Methylomirabilota bacterium]|nr:MoaD/ThiS family protein [Methylomirabilota bacterium]